MLCSYQSKNTPSYTSRSSANLVLHYRLITLPKTQPQSFSEVRLHEQWGCKHRFKVGELSYIAIGRFVWAFCVGKYTFYNTDSNKLESCWFYRLLFLPFLWQSRSLKYCLSLSLGPGYPRCYSWDESNKNYGCFTSRHRQCQQLTSGSNKSAKYFEIGILFQKVIC